MPHRADAAFTIDHKDDTPLDWEGATMQRGRWTKTFTGEMTGTSVVEILMGQVHGAHPGAGPSVYVALERFDCDVRGRQGTFVLVHSATAYGDGGSASWTILTGSGTGELAGISGTAEIMPNHDFALTFELDPQP